MNALRARQVTRLVAHNHFMFSSKSPHPCWRRLAPAISIDGRRYLSTDSRKDRVVDFLRTCKKYGPNEEQVGFTIGALMILGLVQAGFYFCGGYDLTPSVPGTCPTCGADKSDENL